MTIVPVERSRILRLLAGDGRSAVERDRLVALMETLAALPAPPDPIGLFPRWTELLDRFTAAATGDDGDRLEETFLELYAHLHGHAAPYTPNERATVDATGGYWAHAGGLSPVLRMPEWLRPDSASIDYGAGNGLQLLLVQRLTPHRLSVQVEISSRMVACGRALQGWLGIPADRVEWRATHVGDVSPAGFEIIYMYRPVRPDGPGREFYSWFADELARDNREVTILSVADCLRPVLGPEFAVVHADGH
ncbi:MAG: hypothetical protein ACOY3Y_16155, partial [Acidobacteriota bacterium]